MAGRYAATRIRFGALGVVTTPSRKKRPHTLVIDDNHAREPSGLVWLSKTAARISLILHPSEKAACISFFVILRGPYPAGSSSLKASMQ